MKILLSACAANPSHGSEGYFGWSAFEALQKNHEVKVITAQGNRPSIVRELGSEKTGHFFALRDHLLILFTIGASEKSQLETQSLCVITLAGHGLGG